MTQRRRVVALPQFFDRLDELLPPERTADGMPSTADFILHDLTAIVELLATDYEGTTIAVPGIDDRVLIAAGMTVGYIAVYAALISADRIEVYWLDIEYRGASGP